MTVTMRDVARASGVSVGTVSSVINNKNRIGTATRERVLEQIRALGYDPTSNLPRRPAIRKKTIGLVVPGGITEIHAAYYRAIMAAKQATAERGLEFRFHFETEIERIALDLFHLGGEQLDCDGLVVFCPNHEYDAYMRNVAAWGVPQVLIRRTTALPGITVITNDENAAVDGMMDHLWGLGHRRIAFYTSWQDRNGKQSRYERYLHEKGVPADARVTVNRNDLRSGPQEENRPFLPWDVTTAYYHVHSGLTDAMRELLEKDGAPTAVLCQTDYLAVEMVKSLQAAGYRVPDDVSVAGMNDNPAATLYEPRITTSRMPVEEMIGAACDALTAQDAETKNELVFENSLIVRESTSECGVRSDE